MTDWDQMVDDMGPHSSADSLAEARGLKALFFDWNDLAEEDGSRLAYRAEKSWPMPEVGEVIAIGSEDLFFRATVDEVVDDRLARVSCDMEARLPIPLGWPVESFMASIVDEMARSRRYRIALEEIVAYRPEGSYVAGHVSEEAKIAQRALNPRPSESE